MKYTVKIEKVGPEFQWFIFREDKKFSVAEGKSWYLWLAKKYTRKALAELKAIDAFEKEMNEI